MGCSFEIKKSPQLLMLLKKILDESNCKPNKIWVDKGSKFITKQWNHFAE